MRYRLISKPDGAESGDNLPFISLTHGKLDLDLISSKSRQNVSSHQPVRMSVGELGSSHISFSSSFHYRSHIFTRTIIMLASSFHVCQKHVVAKER